MANRTATLCDARDMLSVKSLSAWAAKHAAICGRSRRQVVTVDTPVHARIEHNRWLFDCECGSGVAVHPDWPRAYCLADYCGRVYTDIRIPEDRHAIADALLKRPVANRNWRPGETVADLDAEFLRMTVKRGAVKP